MSDVKWIKIMVDIFDDEKILLIEELPEADSIIVIWFKLLCLAGKQNNSGVFMINDAMPYTDKMLATIFRRKESTVRLALETFENFGMIKIVDGAVTIPNWGKHQKLDKIEKHNEYMRNYMSNYRAKQKQIACKANSETNSESNSKANVSDAERELYKQELYKPEPDNNTDSKESVCQTANAVQQAIKVWNSLEEYGIPPVKRISSSSSRYKSLNARIHEYGLDEVIRTIESIKDSDWLLGKIPGRNGQPFYMTLDWFVLPNNFPKINEGKYLNNDARRKPKQEEAVQEEFSDYE